MCKLLSSADAAAKTTLSFRCQVARTVEVAHVLPLLAQLGAYDGMVALALAKAKALDPETVAAQHSEAGRHAREVLHFCIRLCSERNSGSSACRLPLRMTRQTSHPAASCAGGQCTGPLPKSVLV